MQAQGHSLREISRLLHISRNTVRRILREPPHAARGPALDEALQRRLKDVYARAQGNAVRMGQILKDEDGQVPPYSTLTRWVREADLREPPKRAGRYHFGPGQEMQHDTSPHRVVIAGKTLTAQCAALTLACSRRLFVRYYPRFSRLEAKHFLLQAALFMQGTCARCVIDNTSVVLAGGAGADAVFAPEMVAFAATLGFSFMAHRVGDPDRKGRIERPFFYVQTNFLPGRTVEGLTSVIVDLHEDAVRFAALRLGSLSCPPSSCTSPRRNHATSGRRRCTSSHVLRRSAAIVGVVRDGDFPSWRDPETL